MLSMPEVSRSKLADWLLVDFQRPPRRSSSDTLPLEKEGMDQVMNKPFVLPLLSGFPSKPKDAQKKARKDSLNS